jgi:hypothetical protein
MKKLAISAMAIALVLFVIGCATSAPASQSSGGSAAAAGFQDPNYPPWYFEPEEKDGQMSGIGVATINTQRPQAAMTTAETRARTAITRQLQSIVKNMVNDYTSGDEADTATSIGFQEEVTQALAKATLNGAYVGKRWTSPDGKKMWILVYYDQNAAEKVVQSTFNQPKAEYAAVRAAMARQDMDAAFDKELKNLSPSSYTVQE